jgi:hypothetical protein
MKTRIPLLLVSLVLSQIGCERHPASQTVPGYAEKAAARKAKSAAKAKETERVDPMAPSFFPSPTPPAR